MKRALVTGASGFVGSHLVPYLHQKGYEIWASFHRHRRRFSFQVRWIRADLTRSEEAQGLVREASPHYVFHLAAQAVPRASWKQLEKTVQTNVLASLFLLEELVRYAPQSKVVLVSSCQVYGAGFLKGKPVREEGLASPLDPYAGSKLLMEIAALNFARCHKLHVVIARASNQVGKGQNPSYAFTEFCRQVALIESGKKKPVLKVGNLSTVRDFMHVRDAAAAYLLLAKRGRRGEIYNVSSGKGTSLRRAVELLKKKSRVPFRVMPERALMRQQELPYAVADSSKLRALGWRPRASVQEGLKEILEEWRCRV